ncbi:two-component system response regulator KdpE [Imbroritus primus]|uniref:Two-component system response regulator KdpE n=1 Tax=Imbroritus primus TaxID=3058603 RepID=A0ACD3SNF4_9BURK|nr:two-component system response regulator KdpE [Burkholderiaceae bacterium PBA]
MNDAAPLILIIEDDVPIRRVLHSALAAEGFRLVEAETMQRGLIEAGSHKPDLVILDLGLPDGNGVDFLRSLRAWSAMPVIVLSARTLEHDKIDALDAGADDYLTKPFGAGELLARVRAQLRRHHRVAEEAVVAFGDVQVDLVHRQVLRGGVPVALTPVEYRLLTVLLRHAGKVLTHRQLLQEVWGPGHVDRSHYVRLYVGYLRRKLEADPARPAHLVTETGVGYRFVP